MTDTTPALPAAGGAVRALGLLYAVLVYLFAMGAIVYLMAFAFNAPLPRTVDVGSHFDWPLALLVNLALIAFFGLQHSVMARAGFKAWWTQFVPEPLERPTYLLATALALVALFVWWQPMPHMLVSVENETARMAIWGIAAAGWLIVVISTFLIDHFELNGLAQPWSWFRGRPHRSPPFQVKGFYRIVRHPIQFGVLVGIWATPDLTVGRLLFAGALTVYILIGLYFEERALLKTFGDTYRDYRARVPMLLPIRF